MKAIPLLLAGLLFLVPSVAAAQSVEVLIIDRVEDTALSEVIGRYLGIARMMGPVEVEIEPAFRGKKVTVDLDHTLIGAFKALAEAAGAHLWKLGEGKYAIRAEKPPEDKRPPREELKSAIDLGGDEEEAEPEEEEEEKPAEPLPEWQRKLVDALERTPFSGSYQKTPIPEILADMAGQAGVPLYIDPVFLEGKSTKELTVDYEHALGDCSVDEALTVFCGFHKISPQMRWGALFVTTLERWLALPENVFLGDGADLGEKRVTLKLTRNSLKKAVSNLEQATGLTIEVDAAAAKHCRNRKFTMEFAGLRAVDALSLLLVPEGLGLLAEGDRLVVKVR